MLIALSGQHCWELQHDLQGRYASLFDLYPESTGVEVQNMESKAQLEQPALLEPPSLFDDLDSLTSNCSSDDEADEADEADGDEPRIVGGNKRSEVPSG